VSGLEVGHGRHQPGPQPQQVVHAATRPLHKGTNREGEGGGGAQSPEWGGEEGVLSLEYLRENWGNEGEKGTLRHRESACDSARQVRTMPHQAWSMGHGVQLAVYCMHI